MKHRAAIIHPLLFAAYPALALFAHNQDEVLPRVLWTPLVVSVLGALVCLGIAWIAVRHLDRAAILTSVLVLLVFSYGHVFFPVLHPVLGRHRFILVAWLLITAGSAWAINRPRHVSRRITTVLNLMAFVLVIVPASRIVTYEMSQRAATRTTLAALREDGPPLPDATRHGDTPDIYYIVLDRYPNAMTLRESFGFDNQPFLDFLRARDFVVFDTARANYATTPMSLASSLNMEYLDAVRDRIGEDTTDSSVTFGLIQDHRVQRLLRRRGYEYVHFGSWWEPTRHSAHADVNVVYSFPVTEFTRHLIATTVAYPIFYRFVDLEVLHRRQVLYKLDRFPEIAAAPGPKFVFAHFLIPHPPYVFDRDGSMPARGALAARGEHENFVRQLEYTNFRLRQLVDSLLTASERPPVIILQSDEGPHLAELLEMGAEDRMRPEIIKMKTHILNALHLPGVGKTDIDPNMTPVNTFRFVFNEYFGAQYPLLENKSYWFEDAERPYRFVDVTDVVY